MDYDAQEVLVVAPRVPVRQDFQRGQDVLNTVRTNVLLGSIYLRDALIDRTPASQCRAIWRSSQTSR